MIIFMKAERKLQKIIIKLNMQVSHILLKQINLATLTLQNSEILQYLNE